MTYEQFQVQGEVNMELGQRIKECRIALNKTQQQVAMDVHVTRQTVSH